MNANDSSGFTLIEVLVTMTLIGILVTISMTAFAAYKKNADFKGAVREVASTLRNLQVRAVTEARTYQCIFNTSVTPNTIRIFQDGSIPPSPSSAVAPGYTLPNANLVFVASGTQHGQVHGFDHPDPLVNTIIPNCFFFARGTAAEGRVGIQRVDTGREEDVIVNAVTARVSYAD